MPPNVAVAIQGIAISQPFDPSLFFSSDRIFLPIHSSWFVKALQEYPEELHPLFVSFLPKVQAAQVVEILKIQSLSLKAEKFLRPFFLQRLLDVMEEPALLKKELLPKSEMNLLLNLNRKNLFHVADLLGFYDLAADLRFVIQKELLNQIRKALTPEQQQFLNYCSQQPVKWVPPKLNLKAWDGSKEQLKRLLHARGLTRIAKAVFQEVPSFKWHLLRHMDTGRAKIVQNEFYKKQEPALLPYFKNQVLHLAKKFETT